MDFSKGYLLSLKFQTFITGEPFIRFRQSIYVQKLFLSFTSFVPTKNLQKPLLRVEKCKNAVVTVVNYLLPLSLKVHTLITGKPFARLRQSIYVQKLFFVLYNFCLDHEPTKTTPKDRKMRKTQFPPS